MFVRHFLQESHKMSMNQVGSGGTSHASARPMPRMIRRINPKAFVASFQRCSRLEAARCFFSAFFYALRKM